MTGDLSDHIPGAWVQQIQSARADYAAAAHRAACAVAILRHDAACNGDEWLDAGHHVRCAVAGGPLDGWCGACLAGAVLDGTVEPDAARAAWGAGPEWWREVVTVDTGGLV